MGLNASWGLFDSSSPTVKVPSQPNLKAKKERRQRWLRFMKK
jgi:hypothetical protein